MKKKIVVIEGDGIGPEVIRQAIRVLDTIAAEYHHEFEYKYCLMGAVAIDKTGQPLPPETVAACLESDAILFGAIGDPRFDKDPTAKVRPEQGLLQLRKNLQLFANIRPVSTYPSLQHLAPLKADGKTATDNCIYTAAEIERVARLAFQYAQSRRKKLTLVDKANVLETSRLWRKVVLELAKEYADVQLELMFVDNAAMQLIQQPRQFDVILTENMFGDIISDEASVLSGSLGLLPSASIGNGTALFEPIHGSYPQAAGKDIANPCGAVLSAAMMLDHLGLAQEASVVRSAVNWTLQNGFVTKDIDPVNFYFTTTIGELLCDYVMGKIPGTIHRDNIEIRKSTII